MSQDNENKPVDFDPDAIFGTDFSSTDKVFDPFGGDAVPNESAFDFPDLGVHADNNGGTDASSAPIDSEAELNDAPVEVNDASDKKNKKKKEKGKKPKKEKKEKEKSEPIGVGGVFSLVIGILLAIMLVVHNVYFFIFSPYKEFGVGSTSVIYYLLGFDIVVICGIITVPFLFFVYRKELDFFKIVLGVSVMALSFGTALALTDYLQYDFSQKATPVPQISLPPVTPPNADVN